MSPESAQQFIQAVQAFADPAQAERDRQYHKSARPHWGIKMPQLDRVVKRYVEQHTAAQLLQLAPVLWDSGTFDLMIAAGRVLRRWELPASPQLWRAVDAWMNDVDGWALGDVLAPAAWKCLLHDPAVLDDLERWTTHPGVWRRRAALVYTLPYAKPGRNPERVLEWAAGYAVDPEWFIQKAIGWWLRELSKHDGPRAVSFLQAHWHQLQGVARREARRRLDPESARRLLDFLEQRDQTSTPP
jgi:3-methyladenine DNA glycosylase AlkD